MRFKRLISGLVLSAMILANLAIADTSPSYEIDVSEMNGTGTVVTSSSYQVNSTFVGFVDGNFGDSASYTVGTGLVYLELLCGNGILEFGETCDDGNVAAGDGCSASCLIEVVVPPVCGNAIIEIGEQCDDGNVISGDGCSSICTTEVVILPPPPTGGGGVVCGNGIREGAEQCDDGNNIKGDGCSSICRIEFKLPEPEEEPEEEPVEPVEEPEVELKPIAEAIVRVIKIKARPEKRVNAAQNWELSSTLIFYNKSERKTALVTPIKINNLGWAEISTDRLVDGTYDVGIKGLSHLTKVMRNVVINRETITLDFTFRERFYLLAGDVHSAKDDFVNGLDISASVNSLYTANLDADLNRDQLVNGLDISMVVANLYKSGDKL